MKQFDFNQQMSVIMTDLYTYHRGIENAVSGPTMRKKYGITGPQYRKIINALRVKGYPICSGGCGYWYGKTPMEIKSTINQLQSRIEGLQGAIDGLTKYVTEYMEEK